MVQTLLIEVICKQSSTLTIRAFRCFQTGQVQIIIPIEGKFKGKDSFMFICAKEQQTLSIQLLLICLRALDNNFNGFVFCEFFHLFISPQICKKREDCDTAVSRVFSYMTGFSVVRRRSVPSGQRPFYCIYIGFFCCPPTLRPKVRHPFRILGASRTRGMTPSIHLYYMQNRQKSQQGTLENYFACILPVWRSISCRLLGSTPPGENILFF